MPDEGDNAHPYVKSLKALEGNCLYNAQTYFEATKSAEFWGKVVVFIPAVASAAAGALVAIGWDKSWGVASAMAGLVAATGSFLGAERKAASFKESARKYTALKHEIKLAITLAPTLEPGDLGESLRKLTDQYQAIASRDEPAPNRHFNKASKRISAGSV